MQLELLQAHNLLLDGGPCDHPIDINHLLLSNPMGPVHCLQVLHRVPIVLNKYHLKMPIAYLTTIGQKQKLVMIVLQSVQGGLKR